MSTDKPRVALVCAHPGHEFLVAGMLQRYRPQILFVTQADSGGEDGREELTREGLARLGLAGHASFLGLSEMDSYRWALAGNASGYESCRDRLAAWLRAVRPDVVLGDAFELSNFHHDLCRALLDAAVGEYAARGNTVANYELPLVCRTDPGLWQMRFHEFPSGPFATFDLEPQELAAKQDLLQWLGQRHAQAAAAQSLFPAIDREVYRPVPRGRDYTVPPPELRRHYDEWGRLQVLIGKRSQPILYEEHFVPIIRALGLTASSVRRAA